MALFIAVCLFHLHGVVAQSLTAKVSKNTVALGDHFQVSFDIQGEGDSFTPPRFDDFNVLSGPNKSKSMQWVNGDFSSSVSYSYILQPTKEGEVTIGAAKMKANGNVVASDPISIRVVQGRSSNQSHQHQRNQHPNANARQGEQDLSSNLFMKLYVSKKDAFVGEQLVATYKLFMGTQIVNYAPGRPVYNGFYAQELEVDPSKDLQQEVINGKQFTVATMKKVVLTPQKSGQLEVPPLNIEMVVRVQDKQRGRSLFDQFFGNYRNVKVKVESNAEKIDVKPLPTHNPPGDFIGAVGSFSLSANTDRTEVGVNEALNLTVNLEGNGNIELVGVPEIEFPTDFESYDPKTKESIKANSAGTKGSKSFEYVLIPRYSGDYELEPITMSYFDPKSGTYKRTSTEPIKLNIIKTASSRSGDDAAFEAPKKEDVQILGKDVRYIKTETPDLRRKEDNFFGSTFFFILSAVPFAGMGAAIFLITFLRAQNSDIRSMRIKRAGGTAKKHLAKAKKLMGEDDTVFYEAISTALFGYLSDKLSIPVSDLNREKIDDSLDQRGVSEELQTKLTKALDECEMVRFAPGVVRSKDEMLASSAEIIESLENEV